MGGGRRDPPLAALLLVSGPRRQAEGLGRDQRPKGHPAPKKQSTGAGVARASVASAAEGVLGWGLTRVLPAEIVDQPGVDIFGQVYNQWKNKECVCPNCSRSIAASRFAPHLEKCLGMGRNSSRIANRR